MLNVHLSPLLNIFCPFFFPLSPQTPPSSSLLFLSSSPSLPVLYAQFGVCILFQRAQGWEQVVQQSMLQRRHDLSVRKRENCDKLRGSAAWDLPEHPKNAARYPLVVAHRAGRVQQLRLRPQIRRVLLRPPPVGLLLHPQLLPHREVALSQRCVRSPVRRGAGLLGHRRDGRGGVLLDELSTASGCGGGAGQLWDSGAGRAGRRPGAGGRGWGLEKTVHAGGCQESRLVENLAAQNMGALWRPIFIQIRPGEYLTPLPEGLLVCCSPQDHCSSFNKFEKLSFKH